MADTAEPARQQMRDAGVDEACHDDLLALRAPSEQRGVNWSNLLSILAKLGSQAPLLIAILKKLLEGGARPQDLSQTQAAPKK
jgi:hypothetical protein